MKFSFPRGAYGSKNHLPLPHSPLCIQDFIRHHIFSSSISCFSTEILPAYYFSEFSLRNSFMHIMKLHAVRALLSVTGADFSSFDGFSSLLIISFSLLSIHMSA